MSPNVPPPHPASRPRVLQGAFRGGRFVARPAHVPARGGSAVQPSARGNAFPLTEARLLLRPHERGLPLGDAVLQRMESFFRTSFSDVRVHVGLEASAIGAHAFTVGSDIYFAPGLYQPATTPGLQLLGHELAHVVQQRAGRVPNPFGGGLALVQDPLLEIEADRLGMQAARHPVVSSRGSLQPKAGAGGPPAPHRPAARRAAVVQRNGVTVSDIVIVTSPFDDDAKSGFAQIRSTGNLNLPGLASSPEKGTAGFGLQVVFKISHGSTADLIVERNVIKSEAKFAIGTQHARTLKRDWHNDGPGVHEVKIGHDYVAVADAPGVENLIPVGGVTVRNNFYPQSYPLTYTTSFQVNLRNNDLRKTILAMVQYEVTIAIQDENTLPTGNIRSLRKETSYAPRDINDLDQAVDDIRDLIYRADLLSTETSFLFRRHR